MTLDTGHRRDPNSTMWRMVCRFLVDKKDVPGVASRLPRSAQCTPPQSDCVALAPHRALHYCPDSAAPPVALNSETFSTTLQGCPEGA
eukprot:CAMPEP_0179407856 /NCGR_PEP_ID=MMETSP0799-20121207/1754_1 /TAXON_ID=46947 /ORGANISM="Geminigera cryophila, Strain CCMP2564" /LENGTH=87 /DNA_ID=CAMNT_0021179221 /DNA_START=157 /DNA_END=420 /DNA_ORIENTATION=-